ncbi:hypothetical protein NQ314_017400 [Rhamnusium bicolor]|uniref:Transmembrane protein 186 n=1 Tax=Rhamnusium bicolor TaxID=1586634 RepID=A0AAV8WTH1_9CUCU|nr:hypothetical protein NQ314_017400 [Rhamnusium bicolor]
MNITRHITQRSTSIIRSLRCISLFANNCKQNENRTENFVPVYKFPYIRQFSLINRLKIYQTVLTVTSVPATVILNYLDYASSDLAEFAAALGTSGCLTLYGLGYLTTKFIGFIYYDEENHTAKVSYVDFWGSRKDIIIPANDIVPIDELPVTPLNGLFLTFRRFSTNETLKFSLRYGIILDKEKIKNIL